MPKQDYAEPGRHNALSMNSESQALERSQTIRYQPATASCGGTGCVERENVAESTKSSLRSGFGRGAWGSWPLWLACLFSGGAALVFENLWFRAAGLALGNSVWSAAVVTAAFMAGLGLGNLIAATAHLRIRDAIRAYVWVEVGIAVLGVGCFLLLFRGQAGVAAILAPWHDQPVLLHLFRSMAALLILLAPATGIGITLSLLVAVETRQLSSFGTRLASLYAWNTSGAVLGSVVAEFFLIETCGLIGTAVIAGAGNLAAAALVFGSKRWEAKGSGPMLSPTEPEAPPAPVNISPLRVRTLLCAAMLAGLNLLALEILWFRFLQLFFNGTTKTFAIMLALVLAGLSIGGVIAARLCRRGSRPGLIRDSFFLAGALVILTYAAFPYWQAVVAAPGDGRSRTLVALCAFLILPICTLSGALFGLIGQSLHQVVRHPVRATGLLTLANTIGATAGPLLSAFVLLPVLGVERGFLLIAILYGVAALLVGVPAALATRRWWRPVAQTACFFIAVACFPLGLMQFKFYQRVASRLPDATLMHAREGLTETSFYFRHDAMGQPFYQRLVTHGYSMSASDPRSKRYMKLFAWLPLALHPDPRNALLICFGVGSTASALVATPELKQIDVVDISRDILQSSELIFPAPARNPLNDPRVTTRVEDGRFFLQTTRRTYDLITGEPPPPKIAGIVNLYTEEFFRLVRDRLNPGGYCSYWLPVYQMKPHEAASIARAFLNVFPEATLWEGGGLNWILLGRNGAGSVSSAVQFARHWQDQDTAAEFASLGLESPGQLAATFLADAPRLVQFCADALPLTDGQPQRLSTDMRDRSPGSPAFREIEDSGRARACFESSAWVAAHLPAEIRASASASFHLQSFVNYALYPPYRPDAGTMAADTREILQTTSLRTLPLWMVGSSPQEVAIARERAGSGHASAEVEFHLAASTLAERNYPAATKHIQAALRGSVATQSLGIDVLVKTLSQIDSAAGVGQRAVNRDNAQTQ